jgi:thiol-disulfide isomerase/thioredoxin
MSPPSTTSTAGTFPHHESTVRPVASRVPAILIAAGIAVAACMGSAPTRGGSTTVPGPLPPGVIIGAEQPGAPQAFDLSLTLLDDTPLDVSTLWADRPVLLFFFASWCGECAAQQAILNDVRARYGDALPVVGIAGTGGDSKPDVLAFLEANSVDNPVGIDASEGLRIWNGYAAREPPLVVLVGPGGHVIRGWPGGTTADALMAELEQIVTFE